MVCIWMDHRCEQTLEDARYPRQVRADLNYTDCSIVGDGESKGVLEKTWACGYTKNSTMYWDALGLEGVAADIREHKLMDSEV